MQPKRPLPFARCLIRAWTTSGGNRTLGLRRTFLAAHYLGVPGEHLIRGLFIALTAERYADPLWTIDVFLGCVVGEQTINVRWMSRSPLPDATRDFDRADHVCWAYDEPGDFHSAARTFLAQGLTQGLQVCYIADEDTSALWDDLRDLDTTNRSAVQVQVLSDRYPIGTQVDPVGQVQAYAAATEAALAAGFVGLRVAADATHLVRTRHQLDAMARYEHLVDRYMTNQPFSALCGYNRPELGEETIAQLACLHPLGNDDAAAPFRLCASLYAAASLSGELDASTASQFATALQRADLQPTVGELVIEALELAFIDHRSLLTLADYARRRDATVVLLGDLPTAAEMLDFLDLQDVRIEGPT